MEVQVAFMVPVEVIVDLETRKVTKVVLIDEEVNMPLDLQSLPEVHDRETFEVITDVKIREQAGEIANHADIEWPAWDHGW